MLLAAESAALIVKFTQVLCWIVVPVLGSLLLFTVFIHYRRRKNGNAPEEADRLLRASPEQVGYTNGNGEFILFDHSHLLAEYKNRLSVNHARFTALRQDFIAMQEKYRRLVGASPALSTTIQKNSEMENVNSGARTAGAGSFENEVMVDSGTFKSLEDDNRALGEQLAYFQANDPERAAISRRWADENGELRDRLAAQGYLEDILREKNSVLVFLQSQLEQRVKKQHDSEIREQKLRAKVEDLNVRNGLLVRELEETRARLEASSGEFEELNNEITAKNQILNRQNEQIKTQSEHAALKEAELVESKQKAEQAEAIALECLSKMDLAREKMAEQAGSILRLRNELGARNEVIKRCFEDLSPFFEQPGEQVSHLPVQAGYPEQGG